MTVEGNLVSLFMPFSDLSSDLVFKRHMYLCTVSGNPKEVLLCVSKKPKHSRPGSKPIVRYVVNPDIFKQTSPFTKVTIVDCDQGFLLSDIRVPKSLLTNPRSLCSEFLDGVYDKIGHSGFHSLELSRPEIVYINEELRKLNSI